jgi:CheY-like chemotaxis protein
VAGSILIVDDDEKRRRALLLALRSHGCTGLDVGDAFSGMAALGRANFTTVIAAEGKRSLSLRGLCQLARRRHPEIAILVIPLSVMSSAIELSDALETPVSLLPFGEPLVDAVWARISSQSQPVLPVALPSFNLPNTQVAAPSPADIRASTPLLRAWELPATRQIVLDGRLDDAERAGAALLMSLFAQELTGRLRVDADSAFTVYFFKGEPVWAEDGGGDAALHRRLVNRGIIAPDRRITPVPEGQLLPSLVQQQAFTVEKLHEFMRDVVRDRVMQFATALVGGYAFEEDRSLLETVPVFRVNPFGMVLESRRRQLQPQQLLSLGQSWESKYLVPGPALGAAESKLEPFLRNQRATQTIDGSTTVKQVLDKVGLDVFMGTLVIATMHDTRLVTLEDEPHAIELELNDEAFA